MNFPKAASRRFQSLFSGIGTSKQDSDYTQALLLLKNRQEEWNLSGEQTIAGAKLIAFDDALEYAIHNEPYCFLYAKSLFSNLPVLERQTRFFDACFGEETNISNAFTKLECLFRFERTSSDLIGYFDRFVSAHPEWNEDNSFVPTRNNMVERMQINKSCSSMHAPICLSYYLSCKDNDSVVDMLNLPTYLMQFASTDLLENILWNNCGVRSTSFLQEIHPTKLNLELVNAKQAHEAIEKYGPGLVSQFNVSQRFRLDQASWQLSEQEKGSSKHAMILLGWRWENGEVRYLLQNWWKHKPFLDVNAAFLSGAQLHFAVDAHEINEKALLLPRLMDAKSVECDDLECCEK